MRPNPTFWQNKRVLITGHTGFKGGWLALWLHRLGANVTGLSLAPATEISLFEVARVSSVCDSRLGDIRDPAIVADTVRSSQPQIVLHLAAQALVRASYQRPLETFATNVMGTAHVLDALRDHRAVRAAVIATTDKVYRNREWEYPYREDDALGGHDPYSASKAASEIIVASYRDAFLRGQGVAVATARAGNVIGGGDWSTDRLIPDAVRAWTAGETLTIRSPGAIRPWQHVLEPLAAYLRLAECLFDTSTGASQTGAAVRTGHAYNFGPNTDDAATVGDVIELAREAYGDGQWASQTEPDAPHEAGWLALEVAKARVDLGVVPQWPLQDAVRRTMHWYRRFAEGADARTLCEADITDYEAWS